MLRDCLAGHVQPLAQLAQGLAIPAVQPIQQLPTICIGQSAKHSIVIHAGDMEPFGYKLNRELVGSLSTKNLAGDAGLQPLPRGEKMT